MNQNWLGPFAESQGAGPSTSRGSAARSRHHVPDIRSSSPISESDCAVTLHEFCVQCKLDEDIEKGLDDLGFKVGDDIADLPEKDWQSVGFKSLTWRRVLKVYAKYRRDQTRRKHAREDVN